MSSKILILTKKRTIGYKVSTGLINSAVFTKQLLESLDHEVFLEECIDGNCLDKFITQFSPDTLIVEALWVTPEKFKEIQNLHPKLKIIVRLHSNIPFLAHEGIAFSWIQSYNNQNIIIAVNSDKIYKELQILFPVANIILLENYYPLPNKIPEYKRLPSKEINIGCFGAIRPMKNHLMQAISAIKFANNFNITLNFHINANRIEDANDSILKNLRSLFEYSKHNLIEHSWVSHEDFLYLLNHMDICMQVSFSETFNIVTADAVSLNIPVVVSKEISWTSSWFQCNPTDSGDIIKTLNYTYLFSKLGVHGRNFQLLKRYNRRVKDKYKYSI